MSKYITTLDIKQALKTDFRFREMFPELKTEIDEFIKNPGCMCNNALISKISSEIDRLKTYFPNKLIPESKISKIEELWTVINCNIGELQDRLKKLPIGRKQLAMSRYEDQVTVVVNMTVTMQ